MKPLLQALLAFVIALLVFGGGTWYALEGNDVAIVRTQRRDGSLRETHVWPVEQGGVTWLEAATPESPWYVEALQQEEIELSHAGVTGRFRIAPDPSAAGHARIRSLERAKYGWADRWVALLQDGSRSVAVRLEPIDAGRTR